MKYSMTEKEVCERFYPHMNGKLIGMTRAVANEQLRCVMARTMNRNLGIGRSIKSIASTFKRRMASFIIR